MFCDCPMIVCMGRAKLGALGPRPPIRRQATQPARAARRHPRRSSAPTRTASTASALSDASSARLRSPGRPRPHAPRPVLPLPATGDAPSALPVARPFHPHPHGLHGACAQRRVQRARVPSHGGPTPSSRPYYEVGDERRSDRAARPQSRRPFHPHPHGVRRARDERRDQRRRAPPVARSVRSHPHGVHE
jgi:hypothetical protein